MGRGLARLAVEPFIGNTSVLQLYFKDGRKLAIPGNMFAGKAAFQDFCRRLAGFLEGLATNRP